MKPTIMEGEKKPAVVVETPVVQQTSAPNTSVKKYVVVGVAAVLVTVILTAGLVTTGVLFTKANSEIIKSSMTYKDAKGNDVSEEVEADMDENTATYTIRGPQGKTTVFHDYDTKLGVMVLHEAGEPHCVVHFLNTTNSAVDDIPDHQVNSPTDVKDYANVTMMRDSQPVMDVSFLPAQAQTMCEGMDTYWATEKYGIVPASELEEGGRMKRLTHVYRYVYTWCCWCGRCYHVYEYWYSY